MNNNAKDESFRDSIATIDEEGKRAWIYPKKPKGKLYNKRTIVSIILLTLLFSGPFMKWNGHAMFLFNVIERKFILFGIPFWPQDFFLFVLAMLTFFVFIILFTVVFGRVWCGWACPQTIFMEMVFRKIEYFIEGDSTQQKLLHKAPWNAEKIRKKLTKHSIFFVLAFIIANTFLAYIIGVDQMKLLVTEGPAIHFVGFGALVVFTAVFYGVYARFREQACIVVCPYGRLQGVLLDRNSVVIAYDYSRGEPRGKFHKEEEKRTNGDCIDCHQCVSVCPTGIDIRNGTQLECVNCSACIDACNTIMDKVNLPQGLIRYTSENSIADKKKFKITTRIIGYAIVLLLLLTSLVVLLSLRTDVESTILRTPGQLYQTVDSVHVSNLYNIQLVNKTFEDLEIRIVLDKPEGEIKFVGNSIGTLKKDGMIEGVFFVILPTKSLTSIKTTIYLNVISGDKVVSHIKTNFLGPSQY
ncbi:MAG: cytochrome c oxidase accessory protein CcoG [Bacteroidetes bacterium]|nr:cytochrome c oxidase accessory protein CcoG [Bacteroidota bacterium]